LREQQNPAEQSAQNRNDGRNHRLADLPVGEQGNSALVVGVVSVMVQPLVERRAGRERGKKQNHPAQKNR
jgi:hypothetical protein